MRTLFALKRLDLLLQLTAFLIPLIVTLRNGEAWTMLYAYYAVGAVQVTSYLAHALAGHAAWYKEDRGIYGRALLLIAIAAAVSLACLIFGIGGIGGYIIALTAYALVLISPFLACWYFILCLREAAAVRRFVIRETAIIK